MWQLCLCLFLLFKACHFTKVEIIKDVTRAEVTSVNYPNSYPPNVDKEWHITHDYGRWIITIVDMFLEDSTDCTKDFLEIIEENIIQPKKFCGFKTKMQIVTSWSSVKLRFHTDDNIQGRGFKLKVERVVDDEAEQERLRRDSANAFVHNSVDELHWEFVVLATIVGSTLVVFSGLIIFLIYEMRKKRLRQQSNHMNNIVFQWPPSQRRNSKSYKRAQSNSSTAPLANGRNMC